MSLTSADCSEKPGQGINRLTNAVKIALSNRIEAASEAIKRSIGIELCEQCESWKRFDKKYRDEKVKRRLWEVVQERVEIIEKIKGMQGVFREVERFREGKKITEKGNEKGIEVEDRIQVVMERIYKEKKNLDGNKEQYEVLSHLVRDKKSEIAELCECIHGKEKEFVDLSEKIEEIRGRRLKRSEGIGGSYLARGSQGYRADAVRDRYRESREKAAKIMDTSKSKEKGSSVIHSKSPLRQCPAKSLSDLQREKASLTNQLLKATHELTLTKLHQISPEQPTFPSLLKPNALFTIYGMLIGIFLLIITNLMPRA